MVHIIRSKKTQKDTRFIMASATLSLEHGFAAHLGANGSEVYQCCSNFLRLERSLAPTLDLLVKAGVLFMLHGVGQINAMLARSGAVIVHFYGRKGWDSVTCRRYASFIRGGFVRAPLRDTPDGHELFDATQIRIVAKCAFAVWQDHLRVQEACFDHPRYVTEAWIAQQNQLNKMPPNPPQL